MKKSGNAMNFSSSDRSETLLAVVISSPVPGEAVLLMYALPSESVQFRLSAPRRLPCITDAF